MVPDPEWAKMLPDTDVTAQMLILKIGAQQRKMTLGPWPRDAWPKMLPNPKCNELQKR